MKTSELLFFAGFGAVTAFIITMRMRGWLTEKRIARSLGTRVQHSDEEFGRRFFADPKRADVAVRVRRVLSKNLKMPLEGLTPSDRLEDDLHAELAANPHLFWELEVEFGISTDVEDLEAHEKTLTELITFQDLVDYVERRIDEGPSETPPDKEDEKSSREKSSRPYDLAIRTLPVLFVGGFVTVIAGIVVQKKLIMNLGVIIFLSGIAVFGFANGGEMLRNIVQSARGSSWKEIAARPWPLILLTGVALFFFWIGGRLVWAMVKNVFSSLGAQS